MKSINTALRACKSCLPLWAEREPAHNLKSRILEPGYAESGKDCLFSPKAQIYHPSPIPNNMEHCTIEKLLIAISILNKHTGFVEIGHQVYDPMAQEYLFLAISYTIYS